MISNIGAAMAPRESGRVDGLPRLWRGAALLAAGFCCFGAGIVMDVWAHPPEKFAWILPLLAFGGYLFFARRAMVAWSPNVDRLWRLTQKAPMRQGAISKLPRNDSLDDDFAKKVRIFSANPVSNRAGAHSSK